MLARNECLPNFSNQRPGLCVAHPPLVVVSSFQPRRMMYELKQGHRIKHERRIPRDEATMQTAFIGLGGSKTHWVGSRGMLEVINRRGGDGDDGELLSNNPPQCLTSTYRHTHGRLALTTPTGKKSAHSSPSTRSTSRTREAGQRQRERWTGTRPTFALPRGVCSIS
jgi:hypothetical protein